MTHTPYVLIQFFKESIMNLKFETSFGSPGGFVAEYKGYLAFITPDGDNYAWSIHQEDRIRLEREASTAKEAEQEIVNWIDRNASE